MLEFRPKRWTGLGLVALAGAGLAACGGEAGPAAAGQAGASTGASGVSSGEAASGEAGGEGGASPAAAAVAASGEGGGGEAGAAAAWAAVPPGSLDALKTAQLTGFFLIARKVADAGSPADAAILIDQGLLEVARPNPGVFACCTGADMTAAYETLSAAWTSGAAPGQSGVLVSRAQAAGDAAVVAAGGRAQDVLRGLIALTGGLYAGTVTAAGVDPIEYQHAQGAALALQQEFARVRPALQAQDRVRTDALGSQIDAVVALFPTASAPPTPAPVATVLSALSRAELTLGGIG